MKLRHLICIVVLIFWMIGVFCFSQENSEKSTETSDVIVDTIVEIAEITEQEQKQNVRFWVRKLAHFSLYTLGGVIIVIFFGSWNLEKSKLLIFSQIFRKFVCNK